MGLVSIIYITGIYEPDRVYIGYGEINEDGDETHYYSETKKEYVYEQIIIILGVGGFYLFSGQGAQVYANSYDPAVAEWNCISTWSTSKGYLRIQTVKISK